MNGGVIGKKQLIKPQQHQIIFSLMTMVGTIMFYVPAASLILMWFLTFLDGIN